MAEIVAKLVALYQMTSPAERHVPLMAGSVCGCPQNPGVAVLDGFKITSSHRCKIKDSEFFREWAVERSRLAEILWLPCVRDESM